MVLVNAGLEFCDSMGGGDFLEEQDSTVQKPFFDRMRKVESTKECWRIVLTAAECAPLTTIAETRSSRIVNGKMSED